MTRILLAVAMIAFFGLEASAQKDKSKRPSPPMQATGTIDGVNVTVDYSAPSVKGRKIFGELEAYGKIWRAGANEATWIEFSEDVKVNGKDLAKGKYSFFVIPAEDGNWTLIFNTVADQWGAYSYDEGKDALRVEAAPEQSKLTEVLNYSVSESEVTLKWENVAVSFTVSK